jgi:hypothetical protein
LIARPSFVLIGATAALPAEAIRAGPAATKNANTTTAVRLDPDRMPKLLVDVTHIFSIALHGQLVTVARGFSPAFVLPAMYGES